MSVFGGQGLAPSLLSSNTNVIALQAGTTTLVPPGVQNLVLGKYTTLQTPDPITGIWRGIGGGQVGGSSIQVRSAGQNYRLANQTGCIIGVNVTTAGTGYTIPPTITSASKATFQAILGSVVSSYTVTNGGSNYLYPPIVMVAAPPQPGIQATAYATLTAGVVTSITFIDEGAGYTNVPQVVLLNDPRDTTGYNAQAVANLSGLGGVTAVVVTDFGNVVTGTTSPANPTLTIASNDAGSGLVATSIMDWSITAYSVPSTTSGAGFQANGTWVTGFADALTAGAYTNPTSQNGILKGRPGLIKAGLSSTAISATGQVLVDGGSYTQTPRPLIWTNGVVTTAAAIQFSMGGQNDVSYITPA